MRNYRPTWAEIDLSALWHNYQIAQRRALGKTIIPVIKANAYGHGAIKIMEFLIRQGVNYFAISTLEEGLELRKRNPSVLLLMMGPILKEQLEIASHNRIEITLYDEPILKAVIESKIPLTCHLKIDTGMGRYGIKDEDEILLLIHQLQQTPLIDLRGIYTHFATANEDFDFYQLQRSRFEKIIKRLEKKPPVIHCSNSSSILKYEEDIHVTTHARYGISLYGLSLDPEDFGLKPVMKLKTRIVTIKELKAGECIGYGQTYCVSEPTKIAILPIGYADGFLRRNRDGDVEIKRKRYALVGTICMDACFVKVDESIHLKDLVTLFGGLISTNEVMRRNDTINYEIATSISYRVPRRYIKGGKK